MLICFSSVHSHTRIEELKDHPRFMKQLPYLLIKVYVYPNYDIKLVIDILSFSNSEVL